MRKNYRFRRAMLMLLLGAMFVGIYSADTARAQDFPLALERDTELSPRNVTDYKNAITRYKKFACVNAGNACTIDEAKAVQARDALILTASGRLI